MASYDYSDDLPVVSLCAVLLEKTDSSNRFLEDDADVLAGRQTDIFGAPWFIDTSSSRQQHDKVEGYDDLLHKKDDFEFFRHTRVTKRTHAFILDIVRQSYTHVYRGGNLPVEPRLALDVTLSYLGTKATYREIGEQYGLSKSCVNICVKRIVNILCAVGGDYIKWPSAEEVPNVEKEFKDMTGFVGVIGALDGSHIHIKAPSDMQADYLNRKMTHSVHLMATCDRKRKFTFIDVGFPGSAHDSRVFTSSALYAGIVRNAQQYFPSSSYHIVGDSAFCLTQHVMTPFRDDGRLTNHETRYNIRLSKTRVVIENAFGLLKGRFRRLQYIDADIDFIPRIITAACVLHNITLNFPEEEGILLREGPIPIEENIQGVSDIALPQETTASDKRDFLALIL